MKYTVHVCREYAEIEADSKAEAIDKVVRLQQTEEYHSYMDHEAMEAELSSDS